METKAAAKVGFIVLVGMGLIFAGWAYFAHLTIGNYVLYATFHDTKGLQRQTPVRMNGVTVGEVADVRLDDRLLPEVTLAISDKYRIPDNSRIYITSGLLISNPQIEIKPGDSSRFLPQIAQDLHRPAQYWPADYVQAEPASGLAQLSPEADMAVRNLTETMTKMAPELTGAVHDLRGILNNASTLLNTVQKTTESVHRLVADPKLRLALHSALDDLQAISREARQTAHVVSVELRGMIRRNSGKFDELANGAVDLLQKFADTVDAARGAVTRLTEQVSDPRLQQSLQETLDLAKATIARFGQIATDIHQLTGDANVQSDLKATIASLKATSEEGQQIAERVNNLINKISPSGKGPRFGIGSPSFSIDFLARGNTPNFRSDVNLRFPIGNRNAFRLGMYDFAETYKLNAQYETAIGGSGSLRYGLYASKLGVGMDVPISSKTLFSVDAYNPNRLHLDTRWLFDMNDDFSVWLGADNLFQHTTPLIGVRLKR
jgi:phospholipid/cholesterol/gamma-HCH transport system substrate-binding protein